MWPVVLGYMAPIELIKWELVQKLRLVHLSKQTEGIECKTGKILKLDNLTKKKKYKEVDEKDERDDNFS